MVTPSGNNWNRGKCWSWRNFGAEGNVGVEGNVGANAACDSTTRVAPDCCVGHVTTTSKGFAATAVAFAIWGLFPLYFHPLRQISAFQVIAHRVVWSCVFVLVWTAMRGELSTLRATLTNRSVLWRLAVTATLITISW